jgi:hypothetical protein
MAEPSLPEESIFAQALELTSAPERVAFLDRACGDNRALRAEVEALLRAHERAGDLLDVPDDPASTSDGPAGERPGAVIGPYKLLEHIGEGGMGTVWMADQTEPIQRRVAVKVVKEGMDSKQVLARFEAERQALALMEHPNIARVLDAGKTPSGRPYFVMERRTPGIPWSTAFVSSGPLGASARVPTRTTSRSCGRCCATRNPRCRARRPGSLPRSAVATRKSKSRTSAPRRPVLGRM